MGAMTLLLALVTVAAPPDAGAAQATDVSMVQLLARPDEYDGVRIRLIAYFSLGVEESVLYFHKEDFEVGNTSNGLWLDLEPGLIADRLTKTGFRSGWVIVEGTFAKSEKGHLSACFAGIRAVARLTPWKKPPRF